MGLLAPLDLGDLRMRAGTPYLWGRQHGLYLAF